MAAVPPTHATAADLTLVNRVKAYLRDLEMPAEEFSAAVNMLREEELNFFGYGYFYFNLLSVFRGKMKVEDIRRLALECNRTKLRAGWEFCSNMIHAKRTGYPHSPGLNNWDMGLLKDLLSRKRGLVVCTSHFGTFRHVITDLLKMGHSLYVGLDGESASQMNGLGMLMEGPDQQSGRPSGVRAEFTFGDGRFRVVDVEKNKLATLSLLAALKRNEIVVLYVDGNTGLDGPHGDKNRITVSFLGHDCQVKTGIARLAVFSGAPVLHLVAANGAQGPHLAVQHPFDSSTGPSAEEKQQRVMELTTAFYRQMEEVVMRYPSQWESSCLLHRWRVRTAVPPEAPANPAECLRLLERSGSVRLNTERIAKLETDRGQLLIDVDNLRAFQVGSHLQPVLEKLYRSELSYRYFQEEIAEERRGDIGVLLSRLHSLQWITTGLGRVSVEPQLAPYASPA